MQLITHFSDRIPYGICNAVIRLNANQWRALVQQYGPVFAFQQARIFGGSAAVAFGAVPYGAHRNRLLNERVSALLFCLLPPLTNADAVVRSAAAAVRALPCGA